MPVHLGALVAVLAVACGAGPYGHARTYVTTSDEDDAMQGAKVFDPAVYAREPEKWRSGNIAVFGVVTARSVGKGGKAYVTMGMRRLEPQNVCSNPKDEDSCRVTVSDRDLGVIHALTTLKQEDDVGPMAINPGSLLRVVGFFGEEVDKADGQQIIHAKFYRHWPRYLYVTKPAADGVRQ
jgi:hypothetical protein